MHGRFPNRRSVSPQLRPCRFLEPSFQIPTHFERIKPFPERTMARWKGGFVLSFFQNNPLAVIWAVFGVVWLLPAIFRNRTLQRQAPGSRILHLVLLVAASVLFANQDLGWDPLNRPIVPAGMRATAAGYGLLTAGMVFALWARV